MASAAHCGGPLAKNLASPYAKLPHYPARSASKPRVFGQVRYLTCTAGTEPLYPVNRLQYQGSKTPQISVFCSPPGCWRATKNGSQPNPTFKRLRLRLSSDVFPSSSKGLRVNRLPAYPTLTTDIVSLLYLLYSTYRLYRSLSQEHGALPPQT